MSTGLECLVVERHPGCWYYVLQDWDCPVGAWDWREYATCYGPFGSEQQATDHLSANHANPGGYMVSPYTDDEWDEVMEHLFDGAVSLRSTRWGFYGENRLRR